MKKNKKIIAVDLGGTTVKIAIVSTSGDILQKWSLKTNILNEGREIIPDIISSIKEHIALYQLEETDFLGIGMGSPGTVDEVGLTVTGAYNLNWQNTIDVGTAFHEAFHLPFYLDNDANIAALGEQRYGSGENDGDVVMVTLGTGVGGGVIADHKIIHGHRGVAGEIGHMTIEKNSDIRCTCGKYGCLEAMASATGILNLARKYSESFSGGSIIKKNIDAGVEVTAKEIFDAAKESDIFAKHIVDEFCDYLALGCSHLVNTLNPSKIILGGGVAQAGEYLRMMVSQKCEDYTFPALRNQTEIVIASLGNDAALLGAAELVKNDLKETRLNVV